MKTIDFCGLCIAEFESLQELCFQVFDFGGFFEEELGLVGFGGGHGGLEEEEEVIAEVGTGVNDFLDFLFGFISWGVRNCGGTWRCRGLAVAV